MTQAQALKILQSGKNVFLTGEPGAGKSYTVNLFTAWLKENDVPYVVAAPTGIAATHVSGITIHGLTANKSLSIGRVKMTPEMIENISVSNNERFDESFTARRLRYIRVVILDEISMVSALVLHNLDAILRFYGEKDKPFGGKQLVVVGDFFQLPPIVDENVKDALGKKKAYSAPQWKDFTVCYLTEQHRQKEPVFINILRATRDGKITDKHVEILLKTGKNMHRIPPVELYPTNREADKRNLDEYNALPGEEHKFEMRAQGNTVAIEKLKKDCLSPETLWLKVGTVVMITRNAYDDPLGRGNRAPVMLYANGEIGIVKEFNFAGVPVIETVDGRLIYPQMAEWNDEHSGQRKKKDGISSIFQLPLKHAWAVTIHKSQGMSLSAAKIDLRRSFEFGMGYVAVSRVRSMDGLAILGMKGKESLAVDPVISKKDAEFREESKKNENL